MSISWALGLDDGQATGAASRFSQGLREVDAVIGVVRSSSAKLDDRMSGLAMAEIDARLAAKQLASAQAELDLALGMSADEGLDLEAAQLRAAKGLLAAERESKRAEDALKGLWVAEDRVGRGSAELKKLSDRELEVAASAAKLRAAQGRLDASLRSTGNSSDSLTGDQLELEKAVRAARGELVRGQQSLDGYNRRMAEVGKSSKLSRQALGALVTVAKTGAAALLAVGAAAVTAGGALGVSVFKAQDFARSTTSAFASMTGSVEEGEIALDSIRDIAAATATPLEEVRKTYGTLRATGIGDAMARDLSKMRSDWMAMGEEGEAAFGKLSDAMVEGVATASMFEDLTKNLAGMGVSSRADFGKALGLSAEALERTQEGADLLDEQLKAIDPRKLLEVAVATSKANGELGATSKAAASIGQRLESLNETTTQRFVDEMGLGGEAIDNLLGRVEEMSKTQGFKDFARDVGDALTWIGEVTADTVEWVTANWDTIGPTLKWTGITIGVVAGVFAAGAAIIAAALSAIPAAVVGVISGVTWLYNKSKELIGGVTDSFGIGAEGISDVMFSLGERAIIWGKNLVGGIVTGIRDSIGNAVDAAGDLASGISDKFTGLLGIHSDSSLFTGYGVNIGGGLVTGIEAENDNAREAAIGLSRSVQEGFAIPSFGFSGGSGAAAGGASPLAQSGTTAATPSQVQVSVSQPAASQQQTAPTRGVNGGGLSVTFQSGSIVVNGSGAGTEADLEAALTKMFERIALSAGVAA